VHLQEIRQSHFNTRLVGHAIMLNKTNIQKTKTKQFIPPRILITREPISPPPQKNIKRKLKNNRSYKWLDVTIC